MIRLFSKGNNIKCSNCDIYMDRVKFSSTQLKSKGKRKCNYCVNKRLFSEKELLDNFNEWLINNRAKFESLEIKQISSENRGVISKKRIKPGTIFVSIPDKCILGFDNILESEIGKKMEKNNIGCHSIIAVYILNEKNNPNTFWKPYFDILPVKYENIPLFFNETQIEMLKGCFAVDMLLSKIIQIQEDYNKLMELDLFKFSLHEFIWARTVVITRIFGFERNKVVTSALVPLADMLNHDVDCGTKWEYSDNKKSFIIESTKWIFDGRSIYDSYGIKCNSRFHINYGFCLPVEENKYNNHCVIFIPTKQSTIKQMNLIGEPKSYDNGYSGYQNLIEKKLEDRINTDKMCRFQIPILSDKITDKISKTCIDYMFAHIRCLTLDDDKLPDSLHDLFVPVSKINEISAMKLLNECIIDRLNEFPTTIENDIINLKKEVRYTNNHNILILRISEKTTLMYYKNLSSTIIDNNNINKYLLNNNMYSEYYKKYWLNNLKF